MTSCRTSEIELNFFGRELASWLPLDDGAIREVESQKLWSNFYEAVAAILERETGQISQVFLSFGSPIGGWVNICCGPLLVVSKNLRSARGDRFDSVAELLKEGEEIVGQALELAGNYFDVPYLAN